MVLLTYQTSARCRLWLIEIWQGVSFGVRYMNAPSHVSIIFSSNTWKPNRLTIVSRSCEAGSNPQSNRHLEIHNSLFWIILLNKLHDQLNIILLWSWSPGCPQIRNSYLQHSIRKDKLLWVVTNTPTESTENSGVVGLSGFMLDANERVEESVIYMLAGSGNSRLQQMDAANTKFVGKNGGVLHPK